MRKTYLLLVSLVLIFGPNAISQATPSPIIFIYDASGSMWGQIEGKTKMDIAVNVLTETINKLPTEQKIGLVAYGHRSKGDCRDVETLVDVMNGTKASVGQALKNIKPLGKTPLAYSASHVIDKLRAEKLKATVILVTDGIESCDGDICDVVTAAKKDGIDFRLHIIGFGIKGEKTNQLECAARAGGGQYYDAADAGGLGEVLNEATATTVDEPDKNLSVYVVKNGKPVDAYVKVLIPGNPHSIRSVRTYADTGFVYVEPGKYNLEVKPLEQSNVNAIIINNVQTYSDRIEHRSVSFDGGKFKVSIFNNEDPWDALVNIYPKGSKESAARGRTYESTKFYEVDPGIYDVVIQAMVIEGLENKTRLENIEIKPGAEQEVKFVFKTGTAIIGANSPGGLVDALIKIKEVKSKELVANRRTYTGESSNPRKFILTPGSYEVSVDGLGTHGGKSQTVTIEVKAGESVERILIF